MVLRMESFNILGVHWKIWLLGGVTKNQYIGEIPYKGELGQFVDFEGGLGKKEGVMFLWGRGVDTPMHTMSVRLP